MARALVTCLLVMRAIAPGTIHAQAPTSVEYTVTLSPAASAVDIEARFQGAAGRRLFLLAPATAGSGAAMPAGVTVTDDNGRGLPAQRTERGYLVTPGESGAVRFRYRVTFLLQVPEASTSSGMDTVRLYAVARALFVAPDPTALRKSGEAYPAVRVRIESPAGWRVVAPWPLAGGIHRPRDGEDLLGAVIAAAPDFRLFEGTAGGSRWRLAVRGRRYFSDSVLAVTVEASLSRAASVLGPVPVRLVTYTADLGRKGRMSGSLQGTSSIGLMWEPSEVLGLSRSHDLFHETLHLWFGGVLESERWWVEGVSDYYAARLYGEWREDPAALARLCFQSLRNYEDIEHRTRFTMAEEVRQRVRGDNTELLVYRKGMLAGLLLDAALRRGSEGRYSLDDVSRRLLQVASQRPTRFVRQSEIREAAVALGGQAVAEEWDRVVAGTAALTENDVAVALRVVTGRTFGAPEPMEKERKVLLGAP